MNRQRRIVIDARMISLTGIGRYLANLLDNLQRLDNRNHYVVIMQPRDRGYWQPSAPNFRVMIVNAPEYTLREQLWLPLVLYWLRPSLVHFPAPNLPLLYQRRFVVTVQDLTLLKFRNVRRSRLRYAIKQSAFRLVIRQAIRRAAVVISTTKFGQRELVDHFGQLPATQMALIPLAADQPPRSPAGPSVVPPPYLLYVGNYFPFKNIRRLIEALPAIVAGHPDIKLVLAGNTGFFGAELQQRCRQLHLTKRVVFTGFVPDAELDRLYRSGSLYVFPSLSEGFGIPGLEAMARSLPVAAARATCLPEVYGEAAVYFNPHDTADMARVISDTLADPKKLASLKRSGLVRAKSFSWKRTAEQTLAVYQQILGH